MTLNERTRDLQNAELRVKCAEEQKVVDFFLMDSESVLRIRIFVIRKKLNGEMIFCHEATQQMRPN